MGAGPLQLNSLHTGAGIPQVPLEVFCWQRNLSVALQHFFSDADAVTLRIKTLTACGVVASAFGGMPVRELIGLHAAWLAKHASSSLARASLLAVSKGAGHLGVTAGNPSTYSRHVSSS